MVRIYTMLAAEMMTQEPCWSRPEFDLSIPEFWDLHGTVEKQITRHEE